MSDEYSWLRRHSIMISISRTTRPARAADRESGDRLATGTAQQIRRIGRPTARPLDTPAPIFLLICAILEMALPRATFGADEAPYVSKVWLADRGDGTYRNPILHADYSDPDAIRVGSDYYLVASSFNAAPGIPILQSKDLINWQIAGHVFRKQVPQEIFSVPQHGKGVWAPAIRHHRGEFYIYYPDPDFGIYMVKSRQIAGPWSEPVLVEAGKGLIDPCPLWDDDGKVYLVHAWAHSRAGFNSLLTIKQMNAEGTRVVDDGVMVYDGGKTDPTIEGPKLYKRGGYYYIFAPAGGVETGWQTVLRARHIYGPYERKVVLDQGTTPVNGPHQGALIDTPNGEQWFLHFQDKGPYGRILHLQPVAWARDWPVIGVDEDGDGKGEPVLTLRKPNVGKTWPQRTPAESDEFDSTTMGLQWQWQANPQPGWATTTNAGYLRLFSVPRPATARNASDLPNLLLQKFPAEEFTATARMTYQPNAERRNETAGLIIMGRSYASLALRSWPTGGQLIYSSAAEALTGGAETEKVVADISAREIFFRATVRAGAKVRFSYSLDGKTFLPAGDEFQAQQGRWVGAKMGIFFTRDAAERASGFADFDWFRVEPVGPAARN